VTTSPRPACRRLSTDVRRAGLAAVTAVCVWVIAGCTTDVGGADHPGGTAVATPAETALETLLLDDPDIARITDAPGLHTADSYRTMPDAAAAGRTYSDAFCGAAISAASTTAYDASSANDVRGRRLDDTDTAGAVLSRSVDQAVIAFPDAGAAGEFVAAARTGWAACAGMSVETLDTAGRAVWRVEQPHFGEGVLSVAATHRSGWVTEHAITAQGEIVVDVAVSSADAVTDRAAKIVRDITDRLAQ
jgi:hypothetical protein